MQTGARRIKLREANVKTLSEAEQMAMRLETFRTADQQIYPSITISATVNDKTEVPQSQNQHELHSICDSLETLMRQFQNLTKDKNTHDRSSPYRITHTTIPGTESYRSRRNNFQHTYGNRDSTRQYPPITDVQNRQQTRCLASGNQSSWRTTGRRIY